MKAIIVRFVLWYLRFWAQIALLVSKPTIIGITGSVGKTSTRDAIDAVLQDTYSVYTIRKGNSETGVPLGILGLKAKSIGFDSIHRSVKDWSRILVTVPFRIFFLKKYEYLIVEMGIDGPDRPKNMSYLLSIVKPHIAVVLNAQPVHAEMFESTIDGNITERKITDAIAQEKVKLVTENPNCNVVIYNKDNQAITQFLDELTITSFIYGEHKENNITYVNYKVNTKKTTFMYKSGSQPIQIDIEGYVLPEVYREVIAAAILTAEYLGMDYADIKASLEKNFTAEPGRSTLLDGIKNATIIDSSYNAAPSAVTALLDLAAELKSQTQRPLVFVFGDMRELGKSAKREHEAVGDIIYQVVDYLYTVGPLTHKYVYKRLKSKRRIKDVQAFINPHDAGKYLKSNLPEDAIVLVKGSQNTIFLEEAIKYILQNPKDSSKLPRQEDYWMRKKQFTLTKSEEKE